MARDYSRTQRIADQVQRDLAQLIQFQVKDPRVGMVTINHVKVAKDLGYADVYITVLALGEQSEEQALADTLVALRKAAGFLRTELGRSMKLRTVPMLRFHFDASVERGRRIHALIEEAYQREKDAGEQDSED